VIWSETVSLRTRPVSDQKIGLGLGLASLGLCCETGSCYARRHNDLEGHATVQVLFIVYQFCACNITTVEINSGVYLLKSHICQVPLCTSGGLGLGLVLVLLFWS